MASPPIQVGRWVWAVNPNDSSGKRRPGVVLDIREGAQGWDAVVLFGQTHASGTGDYVVVQPTPHYPIRHATYFYATELGCLDAGDLQPTQLRLTPRHLAEVQKLVSRDPQAPNTA